jgi:hypothetical protein
MLRCPPLESFHGPPHLSLLDLRPAVRPGSILDARPLPRRPGSGLLHALGKWLRSRRSITDLRTELRHVIALLERNQPETARHRLERIAAHLREIRRDGTQFVLSLAEWESIIAVGTNALHVAGQTRSRPEIVAAIRAVLETLQAFGMRPASMEMTLTTPLKP